MKKPGRPPLEPRIAALEALTGELLTRLEALELRFKDYRIAQSATAQRLEVMDYKPQFERWPNQSER